MKFASGVLVFFALALSGCAAATPTPPDAPVKVAPSAPASQAPSAIATNASQTLDAMADKAAPPSTGCLAGMAALSKISFDASTDVQNAGVIDSLEACSTAAEYVLSVRRYPAAWGFVNASYIDADTALNVLQSGCFLIPAAAVCVDASQHGLL